MKLDPRRIAAYLADPQASRGVLVYGEDTGEVRARVRQLLTSVAGRVDDPFRVVVLARDTWGDLAGELATQSLTGGRRAVHLPDATDAAFLAVERGLSRPSGAFLIVEAGPLPARSKLRALFEAHAELASLPCYALDERAGNAALVESLRQRQVTLEHDAALWLAPRMAQDRAGLAAEAERLALFVHPQRRASLDDAQACFSEGPAVGIEDLVYAAASGRVAEVDRGLTATLLEGASPVSILMIAMGHMHRLHRCLALRRAGVPLGDAVKSLRPPVFFKRMAAFTSQASGWSQDSVEEITGLLSAAEQGCKQTGAPAELIARRALMRMAAVGSRHELSRSAT